MFELLLNFTKKKFSPFFLENKIPQKFLYDPFCRTISRLEFKPDFFNCDLKAEYLPDFFKQKKPLLNWEDCCHQRAKELLNLKKNHYIFSWSGGIDSTTMMVAILNTWPDSMKEKLIIYLSHSSIYENPDFFYKYLSKLKLKTSMVDISQKLINKNSLLVTGEMGDQLFGSDIVAPAVAAFGDNILKSPYADGVPRIIDSWTRREGTGKDIFEHFHPIVSESPIPIKTSFDFFWWFNFSQKWQHVKYRFVEQSSWNLNAIYEREILHFFDTPEFQNWSIHNHDKKIGATWLSYKIAAKEYIAKHTKNKAVMIQPKVPSLALRNFLLRKRIAVTSDFKEITSDKELEKYVRFSP